jgi:hypothetical protein
MVHRLNVVSIWVKYKRCVVARVVIAFPWGAIVLSAGCKSGEIESVHGSPIRGLKRQVNMRHCSRSFVHEQFIRIEVTRSFNEGSG